MKKIATALRLFAQNELRRTDLARAARATIGFLTPLLLAPATGHPVHAIFACIAAQNIAMVDVRGAYRFRVSLLAGMTLLLAGCGALGALAAGHLTAAVAGTFLLGLGAALWRHLASDYGPGFSAATFLLFLFGLAAAHQPADALPIALTILGSGAFGLFLQLLFWPFRAQHPLRRAVGDSWVAAATLFETLRPGHPPTALPAAEVALRAALDDATRILTHISARHRASALPARLETLNLLAARLAVRITALHTALESLAASPLHACIEPALVPIRANLVNTARNVAVTVVSRQPAHLAACEVRLRRLDALLSALLARVIAQGATPGADILPPLIERLREVLPDLADTLRSTLDRAGERALFTLELLDVETWQLKPLASALNVSRRFDPALLRFGLRLAVITGLGTFIYRFFSVPHGYWLPFTALVVLQPDYGSTRRKALERVGGTLAGSLAAGLLLWLQPPAALVPVLIALGVFGFAYIFKRNYALGVVFVTIFVVLLLGQAGENGFTVTLERAGATLAGGLLALAAALLFWPVWESDRFPSVLASALATTRHYLTRLQERLTAGRSLDEPTVAAKRHAEAAAGTVFASLARLFADAQSSRAHIESSAALANGNQRLIRLANLLLVTLADADPLTAPAITRHFAALESALEALAAHPPLPAALTDASRLLDSLPAPPADASPRETLVLTHLARAATEARAMLATQATLPNKR